MPHEPNHLPPRILFYYRLPPITGQSLPVLVLAAEGYLHPADDSLIAFGSESKGYTEWRTYCV
jgi:hypothetical protein